MSLQVQSVNKSYNDQQVLFDVSFNVKNGEIVGLAAGTAEIAVSTGKGTPQYIQVTVTDKKNSALVSVPAISFGVIMTNQEALTKASGTVKVNVGQDIVLPTYYI